MAAGISDNRLVWQNLSNTDSDVVDRFFPIVYNELKRLASKYLRAEFGAVTLRTTDLVHEAYIKLAGGESLNWENRAHFFGIAARSMRQILVDMARKRKAQKRGGEKVQVSLSEGVLVMDARDDKVLDLDVALQKLEGFDERLSKIVELRYFSGMTIEEAAVATELSPATVKREWNVARAWLFRELNSDASRGAA